MTLSSFSYENDKIVASDDFGTFSDFNIYNIAPPTGMIIMWYSSSTSPPKGWGFCDGSTVKLNGVDFVTPDMRGRIPFGNSPDPNYKLLSKGGEENVKLETKHIPYHTHSFYDYDANATPINSCNKIFETNPTVLFPQYTSGTNPSNLNYIKTETSDTGGSLPHNNMPPYTVVKYIIKVDYP